MTIKNTQLKTILLQLDRDFEQHCIRGFVELKMSDTNDDFPKQNDRYKLLQDLLV